MAAPNLLKPFSDFRINLEPLDLPSPYPFRSGGMMMSVPRAAVFPRAAAFFFASPAIYSGHGIA